MDIKVLGIDLGKNVCSRAGLDETGAVVFRKRLQRHRLLDFLATLPEPRRVCRRLIGVSYAAMGSVSRVAQKFASASAGGMFPIGSSRRRLLNQSTHSSVAYSTASKFRHGPRR